MRLPALIQLGSTARGGEDSRPSNQSHDVRVVTFTNGKMHVLVGSVDDRQMERFVELTHCCRNYGFAVNARSSSNQ